MVLERALSATGLDWKELVGKGIARLSDELDSDKILFEVLDDGIRISIVCSDEKKREAAELWQNNVRPQLENED